MGKFKKLVNTIIDTLIELQQERLTGPSQQEIPNNDTPKSEHRLTTGTILRRAVTLPEHSQIESPLTPNEENVLAFLHALINKLRTLPGKLNQQGDDQKPSILEQLNAFKKEESVKKLLSTLQDKKLTQLFEAIPHSDPTPNIAKLALLTDEQVATTIAKLKKRKKISFHEEVKQQEITTEAQYNSQILAKLREANDHFQYQPTQPRVLSLSEALAIHHNRNITLPRAEGEGYKAKPLQAFLDQEENTETAQKTPMIPKDQLASAHEKIERLHIEGNTTNKNLPITTTPLTYDLDEKANESIRALAIQVMPLNEIAQGLIAKFIRYQFFYTEGSKTLKTPSKFGNKEELQKQTREAEAWASEAMLDLPTIINSLISSSIPSKYRSDPAAYDRFLRTIFSYITNNKTLRQLLRDTDGRGLLLYSLARDKEHQNRLKKTLCIVQAQKLIKNPLLLKNLTANLKKTLAQHTDKQTAHTFCAQIEILIKNPMSKRNEDELSSIFAYLDALTDFANDASNVNFTHYIAALSKVKEILPSDNDSFLSAENAFFTAKSEFATARLEQQQARLQQKSKKLTQQLHDLARLAGKIEARENSKEHQAVTSPMFPVPANDTSLPDLAHAPAPSSPQTESQKITTFEETITKLTQALAAESSTTAITEPPQSQQLIADYRNQKTDTNALALNDSSRRADGKYWTIIGAGAMITLGLLGSLTLIAATQGLILIPMAVYGISLYYAPAVAAAGMPSLTYGAYKYAKRFLLNKSTDEFEAAVDTLRRLNTEQQALHDPKLLRQYESVNTTVKADLTAAPKQKSCWNSLCSMFGSSKTADNHGFQKMPVQTSHKK